MRWPTFRLTPFLIISGSGFLIGTLLQAGLILPHLLPFWVGVAHFGAGLVAVLAFLYLLLYAFVDSMFPDEPNAPIWPYSWPFGVRSELPFDLIDDRRNTAKHHWVGHDLVLKPEVEEWCKEHGVKHHLPGPSVIFPGRIPCGPYHIQFASKKKATYFKLRWF